MLRADIISQRLRSLDTVDYYFLFLRLSTIVGGLLWFFIAQPDPPRSQILAWLLTGYITYSLLLYCGILRWPGAIRTFYLITLGVDLVFVFTLVRFVGHLWGSFFLAFYLLVAIHSFYFGLKIGLGAALLSSFLYTLVFFDHGLIALVAWPDFLLRITFLFLIALSLGLLAERENRARAKVDELNRELARKNSILEQAYRHLSIGKLIGEIAQGINGPCGIMATRSEWLAKEATDKGLPQEFVKGLEVVNRCSHQIAQTIRGLLTLSKQKGLDAKVLNLNQLITDTLLLMERAFKQRKVKVETHLMAHLPSIKGDPHELQGVLINLISNAVDALPQGGTIEITTQTGLNDGREVECTIKDNGAGIAEENLERIFNPFFTTKDKSGGIGLGLSTSLSIMKKHNGLIRVNSKPGEGTIFLLSLPAYHS